MGPPHVWPCVLRVCLLLADEQRHAETGPSRRADERPVPPGPTPSPGPSPSPPLLTRRTHARRHVHTPLHKPRAALAGGAQPSSCSCHARRPFDIIGGHKIEHIAPSVPEQARPPRPPHPVALVQRGVYTPRRPPAAPPTRARVRRRHCERGLSRPAGRGTSKSTPCCNTVHRVGNTAKRVGNSLLAQRRSRSRPPAQM